MGACAISFGTSEDLTEQIRESPLLLCDVNLEGRFSGEQERTPVWQDFLQKMSGQVTVREGRRKAKPQKELEDE
ncbi:hypothetical protein P7K49_021190 [Saguinus oedipus]|uniref:Uncharacterized protein n=1 Tax=Saguinus oedipus TaxID=9490 RepID=A0ABQ9US02_SAGOE|nr:hypothetical protein P7K49_021190 [Saguinus oedipus]